MSQLWNKLIFIYCLVWRPSWVLCWLKPLMVQILVLENVRFYKEETKNDPGFAKKVKLCSQQCHVKPANVH